MQLTGLSIYVASKYTIIRQFIFDNSLRLSFGSVDQNSMMSKFCTNYVLNFQGLHLNNITLRASDNCFQLIHSNNLHQVRLLQQTFLFLAMKVHHNDILFLSNSVNSILRGRKVG